MKQEPIYIKIDKDGSKCYYSDKKMTCRHRLDGPAIEFANGDKYWYIDGKRHRLDGPAIERADGYKAWYIDGKLHRLDGPGVEWADGGNEWFMNGKLHRLDGPAVEYVDGTKAWFINGNELTETEFLVATTVHELTLDDIAARLCIPVKNLKIIKEH